MAFRAGKAVTVKVRAAYRRTQSSYITNKWDDLPLVTPLSGIVFHAYRDLS